MVKFCWNVNFEEMDGYWACNRKDDGFWLLWGIFKEYIKQNVIIAVLKKAITIQLSFADWLKN